MPLAPPVTSATRPSKPYGVRHRALLILVCVGFDPRFDYPLGLRAPRPRRDAGRHSARPSSRSTAPSLDAGGAPRDSRRRSGCRPRLRPPRGAASSPRTCCRAAELAPLPDETILEVYTALRPRRSTAAELEALGGAARGARAPRSTPAFVREARDAYAAAGASCLADAAVGALRGARGARAAAGGADRAARRARARRGERPERPGAVARRSRTAGSSSSTAAARRTGTRSTSFIARFGHRPRRCAEAAAALDDRELARRLVDVDVPRADLVRLSRGLTPARLARIAGMLDPVELMFALKKLRARRAPANQAHVTNLKENPALLAADAAEAAARGFAEVETTVGVSRYAPLNAIAILVGSQTGRPGVLTQCAVEERLNLRLAIQGLVTLRRDALGVRHRGRVRRRRRHAVVEGVPRRPPTRRAGVKVRFTSGGGSEALMGESEGKSMLYLEARCLSLVRAAGSQGVQNGSISCVALALSVPGGTREVLAENVLAAWLDLEVASGNDAIASHSEIRKTAKLMGQFLPGTDFVTSGYSVDAALRQHVRRRQLRLARPRRVADDPARLAGRRRDRAARRGGGARRPRARRRARCRRCSRSSASRRSPTRRSRLADDVPRLARPSRPRSRRRRARRRPRARRGHQRARRRAGARTARLRRRGGGSLRHAAPAGRRRLPPDLGDHRPATAASSRR